MQKKSIPIFLTIQVESASSHPLLPLSKPWQLKERLAKQRYIYKYELKTFFWIDIMYLNSSSQIFENHYNL